MRHALSVLFMVCASLGVVGQASAATAKSVPVTAAAKAPATKPFSFDTVVERARDLAANAWQEPEAVPRFMQDLTYSQYQDIRFNPQRSLWADKKSRFQVLLVPPGLFYKHAVRINIVNGSAVSPLEFDKDNFMFTDGELAKLVPPNLGYAGFKLTYPLQKPGVQNQFLVFQGASYFRGVGKDNVFGLSGRGLAVDTALPSGEEFPHFREFWLIKPKPQATQMTVYALLDGQSVTGAYQMKITPGANTRIDVEAALFPRRTIKLLGIAPLTSMFFYGENTSRPSGQWRAEVHDSDGLLVHDAATGEWLWRPVINPSSLTIDYFGTENVAGFGLFQRDQFFQHFNDLNADYHKRPSMWVTPKGRWGPGDIMLVQIPTPNETNDNTVAFWTPKAPPQVGVPYTIGYSLNIGGRDVVVPPAGRTINTFVGDGNIIGGGREKGAYRVLVDFAGGTLDKVPRDASVTAVVTAQEQGEVLEQYVEYNTSLKAWRLSILARPAEGRPLDLRGYLVQGNKTLSETWTYRLPAVNDILPERE